MSGVSGVGQANTGSSAQQGTLGNAPPISFPGIASGIDYNAIIQKLTSLTLAQNAPLEAENKTLQAQNAELIKINGMIQTVQAAIQSLGDPTLFNQFTATSSNLGVATASQTPNMVPTAGTYSILAQTLATATQINSDPAANKNVNTGVTLATAGFQITPSNGSGAGNGKFTINGNSFTFDVGTDTVNSILGKINALGGGISASFQNDQMTITSTGGPLSLGSAGDSGNLEQIFKLDTAQIVSGQQQVSTGGGVTAADTLGGDGVTVNGQLTINGTAVNYTTGETVGALETAINAIAGVHATIQGGNLVIETTNGAPLNMTETGGGNFLTTFNGGMGAVTNYQSVTSAATVGGVNPDETLNLENTSTALNGGNTFTINGVALSVNPTTQNLQDIINEIKQSAAGVTATWNTTLGQLQLVAKASGPQSIVLGSPTDSSNFLSVFGLTTGGAQTTVGQQASVTYQTASGATATIFSNSNQVTNVIPGVTLSLLQSTNTPYTVTVAGSNTGLVSAINGFIKAYNAAMNEINSATAAPVVQTAGPGTPVQPGSTQSSVTVPGGVLFGNQSVQEMKDQLVNLISGLAQTNNQSYNSLAAIGLTLDSSFAVVQSSSTAGANSDSKDSNDSGLSTHVFAGTSGQLQALDTTKLDSALLADPTAVANLLNGSNGIIAQLGTYLTFVSGTPTQLGPAGAFLGTAPDVALLQGAENTNSQQIDSINQQISVVNDMAIAQANQLRAEFTASETVIAQLQQEQASLSSILGSSSSSSSSSG